MDLTAGRPDDVVAWHREMGAYLKKIDPYQHLVTSSFSGSAYPELWTIPEIDFSQSHHSNNPDFSCSVSVKAMGIAQGACRYIGLRQQEYSWKQVKTDGLPDLVSGAFMVIPFKAGQYHYDWLNTGNAEVIDTGSVNVGQASEIRILIPEFQGDIACRIKRILSNANN